MSENRLAMVSEWMTNENINQFVTAHPDANRFELVSSPFKLLTPSFVIDNYVGSLVGRRCEGPDPYARSGDDSRRSQRGMSSRT